MNTNQIIEKLAHTLDLDAFFEEVGALEPADQHHCVLRALRVLGNGTSVSLYGAEPVRTTMKTLREYLG